MHRLRLVAAVGLLTALVCLNGASAEPGKYFRSDRGLAAEDAKALPQTLEDEELVWRVAVAPGHSTPCVVGEHIFFTTFENDQLFTVALDRATGRERWRQRAPAERLESFHRTGSPAVATPACDGERVYVFFGSYGLLCYDLAGKLVWSKPLGPFQDEFGSSSSPVLVDGLLLLNEDHDVNSYFLAVDAATGATRWQTPRVDATRSYATPVVWDASNGRQVVVAGALELTGYDISTGRALWSLDGFARIVNTTPTQVGSLLLVATWSPGGDKDARIAMEPWDEAAKQWDRDGDGKLSRTEVSNPDVIDRFYRIDLNQDLGLDRAEWEKYAQVFDRARNVLQAVQLGPRDRAGDVQVVWTYDKGLPYVASPTVYREVLYMVKDGGILTTLDVQTGRLLKQARMRGTGAYYASPVAGDGKVYLASDPGVVTILQAGPQPETLASHDFAERIVATPVLADGRFYLRTEKALYCFARQESRQ